ncbi:MAG: hypothetical protein H0W89_07865 [Candidatus Levybacteria bacterium]|nr:hypothetical protein [Candidatus Levybacteria bacterium]
MDTNTEVKEAITKPTEEKKVSIVNTVEDIKKLLSQLGTDNDPEMVLNSLKKEFDNHELDDNVNVSPGSNLYKTFTLFEFDKGVLMSAVIPERYRTFCIDFNRNLQNEFQCETPSEKATAEVVAVNFIRTLEIQYRINVRLEHGEFGDLGIKYLAVLSKELDRANRHYLHSLQTLKMSKQPMLEVNIKTQTAVIGQNQVVQSNNK